MRKKTPIGKYNPIIQIRWEYRKLEKRPYPPPVYYKCSEDKGGRLSTTRPNQLLFIFQ